MTTLVLSENFLPMYGGTITWLMQTYSRYAPGEIVCIAGHHADAPHIDPALPFPVERLALKMASWDPMVPASFLAYTRALWHVYKSCQRHHVRQMHVLKVLPEGFIAWGMRRFTGMPYVLYAHGEEILTANTSRKLRLLLPYIYNGASAIIANSVNTKSLLAEIGVSTAKIHVIHPGVDATAFSASAEDALRIRQRHGLGQAPVLLTVGRLQRRKGHDMVIQALPRIAQHFPEIKYLIAGSGEELTLLQQIAKTHNVQERVLFLGHISDVDQAAYYAACDIFIMPNRQIGGDIEGFGMVFLEASSSYKPVIGGKSGGTGEAILEGVTGLRVDGTQVEEIAAAVIDLLSNPAKAHAMGQEGRRRALEDFSWDAVARKTRLLADSIGL